MLLNSLRIHDNIIRGEILNITPRLLQAAFATAGDIYTYKLGKKILGEDAGWTSVCGSGSLSNNEFVGLCMLIFLAVPFFGKCISLVLLHPHILK